MKNIKWKPNYNNNKVYKLSFHLIYISAFLCCSAALADKAEMNTTNVSVEKQIAL